MSILNDYKFRSLILWVVLGCAAMASPANAEDKQKYGRGLIFTPDEIFDSLPEVPRFRAYLPERAILPRSLFPVPGYQGDQGSCTAWAVAYGARSFYRAVAEQRQISGTEAFSPAYVYNQLAQGDCDGGSMIDSALNILANQGVARLADFPYDSSNCTRRVSDRVKIVALDYKTEGSERIKRGDLDQIKSKIVEGHPVIVGMWVDDSFQDQRNIIYNPVTDKNADGSTGHAMLIVGYDDRMRAFKLMNSWGTDWRDGGFGWVSYDAMKRRGLQLWTMSLRGWSPDPPAPPSPPPKPTSEVIRDSVATLLERFNSNCGGVSASVDESGSVVLRGFYGDLDRFPKVVRQIESIPGVAKVTDQASKSPWPLCEAFMTLQQVSLRDTSFSITALTGDKTVFKRGEQLAFDVRLPETSGYVYAHYLQANGTAAPLTVGQRHSPGETLLLGRRGQNFFVGPPYGQELLVIISSPKPLTSELESLVDDRDYLSRIREAILNLPEEDQKAIRARFKRITTVEN